VVNIDVSASKNGLFADTGATFRVGRIKPSLDRLCKGGKRAMEIGGSNRPLAGIGKAVDRLASDHGYALIQNLACQGVGRSLNEYPSEIATRLTGPEKRRMHKRLVLPLEPFLYTGGPWAAERDDE
jgi:methionyl aminopeptidase